MGGKTRRGAACHVPFPYSPSGCLAGLDSGPAKQLQRSLWKRRRSQSLEEKPQVVISVAWPSQPLPLLNVGGHSSP